MKVIKNPTHRKIFLSYLFWLFPLLNILWIYLCMVVPYAIDFLRGKPYPMHGTLAECFLPWRYHAADEISYGLFQVICLLVNYGYTLVLFLMKKQYWRVIVIYVLGIIVASIVQTLSFEGGCSLAEYIAAYLFVIITMMPAVLFPYLLKCKLDSIKHCQ